MERDSDNWPVLMVMARAGDRSAYEKLLRAITPMIRSVVRRFFGGRPEVEDIVQDVLLTIHAVRHTYDSSRPFGPWITAVARRRAIDHLRRQGRRRKLNDEFASFVETVSSDRANYSFEANVDMDQVYAAITKLPPGQRQAIELLMLRELSLVEAAAQTGLSITALKVAMHRALKTLRKHLHVIRGLSG